MFRKTVVSLGAVLVCVATAVGAGPVREVARLTNEFRAQNGLPPLVVSSTLENVALQHGQDMGRYRYFSHTGRDGSEIWDRATRNGYRYCVIAENIAKGHRNANAVTKGWINSPGHRRNMLDSAVTEIGVTRGKGDIWVMVLGSRGC